MGRKQIAMAATGAQGGAFHGWGERAVGRDNVQDWDTGRELLEKLETACSDERDCIGDLYIFSHAWAYKPEGDNRGGVYSDGPAESGFYSSPQRGDYEDARYSSDLASAVNNHRIRFCNECRIVLTGCRVGASSFPSELVQITGCQVLAANGSSRPKPAAGSSQPGDETGEWESAAGGTIEKQSGSYLGWKEYSKDEDGNPIERDLGAEIDIW